MAASTPNTIILFLNGGERPIYDDKKAVTAAVTPGDLVELVSASTVTPVATADKAVPAAVALENPYAPDPTKTALEQTYPIGATVRYVYLQPGDLVYMRVAQSQTVSIGSLLASSTTAGCLEVEATNKDHRIVGIAEEAVTTTGAEGRVKVRII